MGRNFIKMFCLTAVALVFLIPAMADQNQIAPSSTSTFCIEPNYPGIETERAPKGQMDRSKNTLETFCILPEDVCKVEKAKDPSDCAIRPTSDSQYPCKKELWLRNGNRCVAIVRVEPDDRVVLNPAGFNYGPIPMLSMLNESDADLLWGTTAKIKHGEIVSYTLPTYQSADEITIETIFENTRLKKYKIVGASIPATSWKIVE